MDYKTTVKEICDYIGTKISIFNNSKYNKIVKNFLDQRIVDVNAGWDILIERLEHICKVYNTFLSYDLMSESDVINNLNRIIVEEGMLYEAIGYYWLMESSMQVGLIPIYKNSNNCSGNEVALDGEIEEKFAFDIKKFQTFEEIIRPKLSLLNKTYPGYVFFLQGCTEISKNQFWNKEVQEKIAEGIKSGKSNFGIKLPNGGEISIQKRQKINMSESYSSPIRWCANNYKFVLAHSGQFTTDRAFVQIEMFNLDKIHTIDNSPYLTLRIMARRIFFELSKSEENASEYCDKIKSDKKVKDVIQYLSGIWFMDIVSGHSWVYLNPFAKHKLSTSCFEPYGWDNLILGDDFSSDNY